MSDEFLKVAKNEIKTEIESLKDIFLSCTNDEQLYKKSTDIEKHMHKIKGLAPMMGQDSIGEIAGISDIILKHVTSHSILKNSHKIIFEAISNMSDIFDGHSKIDVDNFRKKVKEAFPEILGI
jgi:chemotaxis protein histidine kinase CheA